MEAAGESPVVFEGWVFALDEEEVFACGGEADDDAIYA